MTTLHQEEINTAFHVEPELNRHLTLQSSNRCFDGEQRYYMHTSAITQSQMTFSIYLPDSALAGQCCPAILYLSGLTSNPDSPTQKAHVQKKCSELGVIFIAPDTSPRSKDSTGKSSNTDNDALNNDVPNDERYYVGQGASYYVDAQLAPWSHHFNMYSYIIDEFYPLVCEQFNISSVGISGHSMGGHGALRFGFMAPDKFISVSAFSPISVASESEWGQAAFKEYFGEHTKEDWAQYDATYAIKQAGKQYPSILVDQGDADEYYHDGELQPEQLQQVCQEVGQPLTLRYHAGFDHSYYFVQTVINDHIEHHYKAAQLMV